MYLNIRNIKNTVGAAFPSFPNEPHYSTIDTLFISTPITKGAISKVHDTLVLYINSGSPEGVLGVEITEY